MKNLYIPSLTLFVLACLAPSALPVVFPSRDPAPVPPVTVMVVTGLYNDEPLNIRETANGAVTDEYLYNGDVIIVTEIEVVGDTAWCKHELGWSACRYLVGYNKEKEK